MQFVRELNLNLGNAELSTSPAVNQLPLWANNQSSAVAQSRATTLSGVPVPSLTASQAIGTRGHLLFQDFTLFDKLGHFVRERFTNIQINFVQLVSCCQLMSYIF